MWGRSPPYSRTYSHTIRASAYPAENCPYEYGCDNLSGAVHICRVQQQKRKRRPRTTPWTCGGSIPPLGSIARGIRAETWRQAGKAENPQDSRDDRLYIRVYIYILISGKERFKYAQQEQPQSYALCVTFSYESEENIDLYNQLRNNVKLKAVERERDKVQPRIKI